MLWGRGGWMYAVRSKGVGQKFHDALKRAVPTSVMLRIHNPPNQFYKIILKCFTNCRIKIMQN